MRLDDVALPVDAVDLSALILGRDGAVESVEGAPSGCDMRLALRRTEVVRSRQGPSTRNIYGEIEPGATVTAVLPASVQPVSLEDQDFVGGAQLMERLKVYVPTGIERGPPCREVATR